MATTVFFSLAPVAIYFVAGIELLALHQAPISLGVIIAFTAVQSMLFSNGGPITRYFFIQAQFHGSLALFDRIFEYLSLPVEIKDAPNVLRLSPPR